MKVGEKRLAKEDLSLNKEQIIDLMENLYEGMYIVDRDCRVIYWNKGAELITGYSYEEVLGRKCSDNMLSHIDEKGNILCEEGCPLKLSMRDGNVHEIEAFLRHRDGHRVPVSIRTYPIINDDLVSGAVQVFVDNSSRIASLHKIEELQRLVIIDHLTGLTNRRFIEMSLEARLNEMQRYGWPFGVLFIDIDNFKSINDLYGHETGDNVLKMIAQTFISNSRPFDVTGRWGGEEFVSIILNVDKERLFDVANRLRILIEQSVMTVDSVILRVTVSIGATLANSEDTIESLIRRADRLMYHAKISGKNRVMID